jgi:hypothetical protein
VENSKEKSEQELREEFDREVWLDHHAYQELYRRLDEEDSKQEGT